MSADLPSASTTPNVPFVLLYTTAEQFRPTYRRGILDALAYPADHTVEYSYRSKNVAPSILQAIADKALEDVPGVIVFVDVPTPEPLIYSPQNPSTWGEAAYYPLRRVTLTAPDGPGGMQEREKVRLRLTLGNFITYEPHLPPTQWHGQIAAFDAARGFHGDKPSYFVVPATDILGQPKVEDRTAWEDVVTAISRSHQLSDCVFVRVPPLRRLSRTTTQVRPSPSRDSVEYVLEPDSVYRLELSVFEPHSKDGGQTKIAIKSSSDEILQVDQPFQSMVAGTSEWAVHLATRRNLERDTGAITVEVTGSSKTGVTAPNPILFVHIPVGWPLVFWFLLLVFIGVFLASLDKEAMAGISNHPALYAILAKLSGSALLAVAAWVGFRKLPSAIRG